MKDFLFKEFNEVSAKQWKQKIQFDLKGADYNEALVWESNEGIKVKPFYHLDEFETLDIPKFTSAVNICQSIFVTDENKANFLAKDALKRGADAIQFEAHEYFDITLLLTDLRTSQEKQVSLYFKLNFLSQSFLTDLLEKTKDYTVFLNIDPIGNLTKEGNWFINNDEDFKILREVFSETSISKSIIGIDASHYQNAGANIVQQIAYALAHANEYLNFISNENISLNTVRGVFQFNFAVEGNYFFEIAKLRAFRYLWRLICKEYNLEIEPHVFVMPSLRNKTLYDYNTNMLRTTSECMSALLGGANAVSNVSYDAIFHKKNEFGERIARNQLLILLEESYFKNASSFIEGSYYIESLTKQLAEKSLSLFKDIERSGGFIKQLFEGTIQRKIEENAAKEQLQFDNTEKVLLGTNKYPDLNDKMKDNIELYPFVKINPRKTLIQPIIARRLSEKLEKERLDKEKDF